LTDKRAQVELARLERELREITRVGGTPTITTTAPSAPKDRALKKARKK
jgi:hypothetical protein